jgi:hypothetical protein
MKIAMKKTLMCSLIVSSSLVSGFVLATPPLTRPQYTPCTPPCPAAFGPKVQNSRPKDTTVKCQGGNYDCAINIPVGTVCQYCQFDYFYKECASPSAGVCCQDHTNNTAADDCGQVLISSCDVNGKCYASTGAGTNGNRCSRDFASVALPCP